MLTKIINPKPESVTLVTDSNLILDSYPEASLAFSLRKLRDNYTGSCVKVRRSSDNAEQEFGFVNNYLDTAGLLSFCGNGDGFVVIWYDQSFGNGASFNPVVAEQYTATRQPRIVISGSLIYGGLLPCISFDGASDFLQLYLPYGLAVYNPYMFFVVEPLGDSFAQTRNGGIATFYSLDPSSNSNHFGVEDDWYDGFFSTTRPQITSQNITRSRYIGELYQNGTQIVPYLNNNSLPAVSATIDTRTFHTYNTIGNPFPTSNFPSYNLYEELILFRGNQTPNRAAIEANMNNFYRVHWNGATSSLLSTYTGASAAYSLRALNGSYQGPLVRVRRASDNKEANIYAMYEGQIDIFALQSFCSGTNGFVTTWYDQSGNGRNAIQATAGNQPQIVNGGTIITWLGKPAIDYLGGGTGLQTSSFSSINASVFIAAQSATIGDDYYIDGLSSNNRLGMYSTGTTEYTLFTTDNGGGINITTVNKITPAGSANVLTFIKNSNNLKLFDNSFNIANITVSSDPLTLLTIGSRFNFQDSYSDFYREIIVYPIDQTSNKTGIESNIMNYYNI
jgi:hypothetical protein